MDGGLAFFLLAIVGVVGFLAVGTPIVFLVNRAIGKTYDDLARSLEPYWENEGIRFREDGVRSRASWRAPFAVAIRWPWLDVRVTSRGIYLVQSNRMFGARIGQPIVAAPFRGATLDPVVAGNVRVASLDTRPRLEGAEVILDGTLGAQRFTWRLTLRDPAGFLAATGG